MLDNCSCFCCRLPTFFKIKMFKENSGFKLFSKVISRRENSPTARKELSVAGLKIERSYPCLCGEDTV